MSRYSTCPPLVYVGNQASGQNLVESTKLERIIVDSKKAHRKEKKEKRKLKKEKHEKRLHKHSKTVIKQQQHLPTKETVDESEQLEKSGLTEELEGPQKLGYSSDGSQNSKKRKRENSPPAVESLVKAARVAGNPLRIRLIFKKPKEDVQTLPREDRDLVCSTSAKEVKEIVPQEAIANPIPCLEKSELEENLPSTSSVALIAETKKRKKHKTSKEERYNALFDDWTQAPICLNAMEDYSKEDDDWLFGSCRTQEKLNHKASVDEDMKMSLCRSEDYSCWPNAQFLSEVGIYSLPYAIPF